MYGMSAGKTHYYAGWIINDNALTNKTIGYGEVNNGFVYFLFKGESIYDIGNISKIKFNVERVDTRNNIEYEYKFNTEKLITNVNKLNPQDSPPVSTSIQ